MKNLDFAIIGAQKCATTTLFELLRQHPDINMPLEKEVPFFTGEDYSAERWQRFSRRYFGPEDGRLWGKASPQYMADTAVAARFAQRMPQARLIAVLRDPLERARSHYRMGLRRATEARSFATAISDNLAPAALTKARTDKAPEHSAGYESEGAYYVAWSEYGRILSEYRRHFADDQILVIYTSELEDDPRAVLDRVLAFLDLDGDFHPRGLGDVIHAGGGANRVPHSARVWLRQRTLIARLWRLVPAQQQGRLRFLYERWNSGRVKQDLPLPEALETTLRDHFADDLRLLRSLGIAMPEWSTAYLPVDSSEVSQYANTGIAYCN